MTDLVPVFNAVLALVVGIVGTVVFNYFKFFRHNKVEDRKTETERLEAENQRASDRADKAQENEEKVRQLLRTTRAEMFDLEEYISQLRAQLTRADIEPIEYLPRERK